MDGREVTQRGGPSCAGAFVMSEGFHGIPAARVGGVGSAPVGREPEQATRTGRHASTTHNTRRGRR